MFEISTEEAGETAAVKSLLTLGFGSGRQDKTVYRLRLGTAPADLSFAARTHGTLIATLRFWPVTIGEATPALLLGPLAVTPELRGRGIGRRLVSHGLEEAVRQGWRICLVVGEPVFYVPFGFEPAAPWGLTLPGPVDASRFQVRTLDHAPLDTALPAGAKPVNPWRSVRRRRLKRTETVPDSRSRLAA